MMKCTELLKNGNKSLVEVRDAETNEIKKYVVCQDFNNVKEYGNKWIEGTYFDIWGDNTQEKMMRTAALFLYGIDKNQIPYERMSDLAKAFIAELQDYIDDNEEFARVLKGKAITEKEAEYFGVKDIVFPRLYKVVDVILKREQYVTVAVVIPDDEDYYEAENHIGRKEYIEDSEYIENEEWKFYDYEKIEEDITREYFKQNYDSGTVWNAEEIDDM